MDRRSDNEDMKNLLLGMNSLHGKVDSMRLEILGNSLPGSGRLRIVEDEVDELKKKSNYLKGIIAGLSILFGVVEAWLHGLLGGK